MSERKVAKINEVKVEGQLVCPLCGGMGLHQQEARVIFRHEDDSWGTEVTSNKNGSSSKHKVANEIPGRRDVMEIDFGCETCNRVDNVGFQLPIRTLEIRQHKGRTLMNWFVEEDQLHGSDKQLFNPEDFRIVR